MKSNWLIASLFIIAILNGLVFQTAQCFDRFLSPELTAVFRAWEGFLMIPLYVCAVVAALSCQRFSRIFGMKLMLIAGLAANFFGIALYYEANLLYAGSFAVYLTLALVMAFLGIAIGFVAPLLATYVIIEFPNKTALGIILLFSCLNIGVMIARPFFDLFYSTGAYMISLGVIFLGFLWIIHAHFINPPLPKNLEPVQKESLLWNELHRRLGIFIFAMILYGVLENIFNKVGDNYLQNIMSHARADQIIVVFWLALTVCQLTMGLPAYWAAPLKVLRILPFFIILALILIPLQNDFSSLLLSFIIAGIGCSAIFPLILAMLQLELRSCATKDATPNSMLPYYESACGYMVASYLFGVGLVDLQVYFFALPAQFSMDLNFYLGIALAVLLLLSIIRLEKKSPTS